LDVGRTNPDIFYTDKYKNRNSEYISLGADDERIFEGRTPIEIYRDFMEAFKDTFLSLIPNIITSMDIGMGPAGELRFPSYPMENNRWRFPGIGEFQCYDKYLLQDLKDYSVRLGKPEWGKSKTLNERKWRTF
jgi:beta-amylase